MKRMTACYRFSPLLPVIILVVLVSSLLIAAPLRAKEASVTAPMATRSLLLDLQRVDNTLIAVGEWGHILLSEDSGTTWSQAQIPSRATLTAAAFFDRQHGLAVGHGQVILRTVDGGKSWQKVHEDIDAEQPLLDVQYRSAEQAFAVGAYGAFLETLDGGATWEYRSISEDDMHLNQIEVAGNRLLIAAEAGTFYRSTDGGETWETLEPPYEGSFFGSLPLAGDSLLLFGLRGNLFRSDDAGDSWTELDSGTEASLTNGLQLADGTLVIAGLAGVLLVSNDGGKTFKLHQESDRKGFAALQEAADGTLVTVGEAGIKRITRDSLSR